MLGSFFRFAYFVDPPSPKRLRRTGPPSARRLPPPLKLWRTSRRTGAGCWIVGFGGGSRVYRFHMIVHRWRLGSFFQKHVFRGTEGNGGWPQRRRVTEGF